MRLLQKSPTFIFLLVASATYAISVSIIRSAAFRDNPELLSMAVAMDLTVTITALFYFLVVWPKDLPEISVAPIFLISIAISSYILPAEHQDFLQYIKYLIVPAELAVAAYLIYKVRQIRSGIQDSQLDISDFPTALRHAAEKALGSNFGVEAIVSEFSTIYYAFFSWRKTPQHPHGYRPFSYHIKCGWLSIMMTLMIVLAIETVAIHLLVERWSVVAAWVLTALSIYSAFWLIGDYRAMLFRPILIGKEMLKIRIGMRWSADIPLSNIDNISANKQIDPETKGALMGVAFGSPNVVVTFKDPLTFTGIMGFKKTAARLYLSIDEKDQFLKEFSPQE